MSKSLADAQATTLHEIAQWWLRNASIRHGHVPYPYEVQDVTAPDPQPSSPPVGEPAPGETPGPPEPAPTAPPATPPAEPPAKPAEPPEPEPTPLPPAAEGPLEKCSFGRVLAACLLASMLPAGGLALTMWLTRPDVTIEAKPQTSLLQSLEDRGHNVP